MRQIVDTVYGTGPAGLPGNDDLGTMSAWYVFSALGLYPQTPGSASMLLSAPLFPHAVVDRPGRDIVIDAPAADAGHPYVSGVRLNGRPYDRSWTDARFLQSGGTLTFRLGEQPDTDWATSPESLPR
ncbi:glycoside hydrolase domain-containing protein [Streptomyces xiangluensis]|uniref:Glycoside hydrolase domain-containing protein n=1 Tax=Streptomyces xiangluensis TaxID=2665720 RepID=A0ABV8YZI1_9ACTN